MAKYLYCVSLQKCFCCVNWIIIFCNNKKDLFFFFFLFSKKIFIDFQRFLDFVDTAGAKGQN